MDILQKILPILSKSMFHTSGAAGQKNGQSDRKRNFVGLNIGCGTSIWFVIRFVLVLVVVLDAVLALSISRTRTSTTTRTMITLCIRRTSTLGSTTVFCFRRQIHTSLILIGRSRRAISLIREFTFSIFILQRLERRIYEY